MDPICCLSDYVHEHYEQATQWVDKTQDNLVFQPVISCLGVGPFTYEGIGNLASTIYMTKYLMNGNIILPTSFGCLTCIIKLVPVGIEG